MSIFDDIGDIPDVAAFLAESNAVPMNRRVQVFLAGLYGAAWLSATVFTWSLPDGSQVYGAFKPRMQSQGDFSPFALLLVGERADGALALAAPMPPDEDESEGESILARAAIHREQICLSQILPALQKAREIIEDADICRKQKKRVQSQLAHAAKHLEMQLDQIYRGQ